MLNRFANVVVVSSMLLPLGAVPIAFADDGDPPPPPPDNGIVASEVPGIAHTPDGRTLTVVAKDETQLPIAPLTTSLSSREWLVGATFTGSGMGDVKGGSLEVGYQIGCAIQVGKNKLNGSMGLGT